jgi:Polyketide cyclase / dehydrase and lipid transport
MWQAKYETTTDVPAEKLFRAISDVNNWNKWDAGLESTWLEGVARQGVAFRLKPKGGPIVKLTIDEVRPYCLVDTAHLFFAKMRTSHEYVQSGDQTTIRFQVEVWGLMGFFWRKVVGEDQIKGAAAQTLALIDYARII